MPALLPPDSRFVRCPGDGCDDGMVEIEPGVYYVCALCLGDGVIDRDDLT